MIVKTDYGGGGAGDLLEYMERDEEERVELRDHAGKALSDRQREAFLEQSRTYDYHRQHIISPDPRAGYDRADVATHTRATMAEFCQDRPTAAYVYAVHTNGGATTHAHVAITGRRRVLQMDPEELQAHRESAREAFREPERLAQREAVATADAEAEREAMAVSRRDYGPDGGQ